MILLSILIPTYNRSFFLNKNLEVLKNHINNGKFSETVEIIVSSNNSSDDTDIIVQNFKNQNSFIKLKYFTQKENLGPEKNILFTLEKASGKFVMFLGDDDYIDFYYLKNILILINNNEKLSTIIPSFIPVDMEGENLPGGRDCDLPNRYYKAGYKSCLTNSWRGHQLSGLTFKRDGLFDAYSRRKVNNIYPQIFFVAYSCLKGDAYHLTQYPVKVTQPGQENKDWNYGKDGLINEIFDNYKKLPINNLRITQLQLFLYKNQSWRLLINKDRGIKILIKTFFYIWRSTNSSILFKILFPFEVLIDYLNRIRKKTLHRWNQQEQ